MHRSRVRRAANEASQPDAAEAAAAAAASSASIDLGVAVVNPAGRSGAMRSSDRREVPPASLNLRRTPTPKQAAAAAAGGSGQPRVHASSRSKVAGGGHASVSKAPGEQFLGPTPIGARNLPLRFGASAHHLPTAAAGSAASSRGQLMAKTARNGGPPPASIIKPRQSKVPAHQPTPTKSQPPANHARSDPLQSLRASAGRRTIKPPQPPDEMRNLASYATTAAAAAASSSTPAAGLSLQHIPNSSLSSLPSPAAYSPGGAGGQQALGPSKRRSDNPPAEEGRANAPSAAKTKIRAPLTASAPSPSPETSPEPEPEPEAPTTIRPAMSRATAAASMPIDDDTEMTEPDARPLVRPAAAAAAESTPAPPPMATRRSSQYQQQHQQSPLASSASAKSSFQETHPHLSATIVAPAPAAAAAAAVPAADAGATFEMRRPAFGSKGFAKRNQAKLTPPAEPQPIAPPPPAKPRHSALDHTCPPPQHTAAAAAAAATAASTLPVPAKPAAKPSTTTAVAATSSGAASSSFFGSHLPPAKTRGSTAAAEKAASKRVGTDMDNAILIDDDDPASQKSSASTAHSKGEATSGAGASSSLHAAASSASPSNGKSSFHLVYPPRSRDGLLVTGQDLQTLRNGEFLNDVIVDFYLKWLLSGETTHAAAATATAAAGATSGQALGSPSSPNIHPPRIDPRVRERTHCFNSFFYKKYRVVHEKLLAQEITKGGGGSSKGATAASAATAADHAHRAYSAVARWTKGVNIFEKDFIIVPINDTLHWSLAIIMHPRKFFQPPPPSTIASASASMRGAKVGVKRPPPSPVGAAVAPEQASPSLFRHWMSNGMAMVQGLRKSFSRDSKPTSGGTPSDQFNAYDPFAPDENQEEADGAGTPTPPPQKKQKVDETRQQSNGRIEEGEHKSYAMTDDRSPSPIAASASSGVVDHLDTNPSHLAGILYLDSLLPPPYGLYDQLTSWLKEEWRARYPPLPPGVSPHSSLEGLRSTYRWVKPPYFDAPEATQAVLDQRKKEAQRAHIEDMSPFVLRKPIDQVASDPPFYVLSVPEQKNGSDCGLYLLEYTKLFLETGTRHLEECVSTILRLRPSGRQAKVCYGDVVFEKVFFTKWKSFPTKSMNAKRHQITELLRALARQEQQQGGGGEATTMVTSPVPSPTRPTPPKEASETPAQSKDRYIRELLHNHTSSKSTASHSSHPPPTSTPPSPALSSYPAASSPASLALHPRPPIVRSIQSITYQTPPPTVPSALGSSSPTAMDESSDSHHFTLPDSQPPEPSQMDDAPSASEDEEVSQVTSRQSSAEVEMEEDPRPVSLSPLLSQ